MSQWNNPQQEPGWDDPNKYHAQQQPGYSQFGPPPVNYETKPTGEGPAFTDKFSVPKPKWNDVLFIPVFLATVGGFVAVAAISLSDYVNNRGFEGTSIYNTQNDFGLNTHTIILFSFVSVAAVVVAFLYYLLARIFTKQFIIITMILQVAWALGTAIYYLIAKYWSAGIVALIWAAISAFCYWTMRHRIPFATLVLKTIIDVTRLFPSTLISSAIGALASGALSVFFSVVMVAVYMKWSPNSDNPNGTGSQGKLIGLVIFVIFATYYMSEVLKNIIRVTVSGIYGSWYYCYKSDQGMPRHPALGAFRRAMTYSFGSICFGSLIVAFINFVRELLNMARQANAANGGSLGVDFLLCCINCVIGIIDWLVTYFNNYAYTYIALYGKAYIPAARDTWQIVKARGIDALVNDCLIGNVLTFGSTTIGFLTALLGYLYLKLTDPAYNSGGGFYPIIVAFSFLIGVQIGNITTVSIGTGVQAFFVALAKDPDVFRMSYPDVYERLLETYPQVREKLNIRD